MNRTLKSILTLTTFGAAALGLSAQPAIKIVTVDMAKLFEGYYKTEQEGAKLRASQQKVQDELEHLVKEGTQLGEKYKETLEQAKNTLLTADARSKAEADSGKMLEELRQRQNNINTFQANNQRAVQQQVNNMRGLLIEEISKKVADLGKGKGATIIAEAHSGLIYSDAAYDITDEALALINKDRPATPPPAAAPAAPAPAVSTPTAATSDSATVTVPGLAPKK